METYTQKQLRVLEFFRKNKKNFTPKEAAEKLGYKESSYISYPLKKLTKNNLLQKNGKGRKTKYGVANTN